MLHDIEQNISAALNLKIKPPVSIDSRLPHVLRFVVFLSVEGRVAKILGKKANLLLKDLLDTYWCGFITAAKTFCPAYGHERVFSGFRFFFLFVLLFRSAINSSTEWKV